MQKVSNNEALEGINTFLLELAENERAGNTLKAYKRDIIQYVEYLKGAEPTLKATLDYKAMLKGKLKPATLNRKLIAINKYLKWAGYEQAKVKLIKTQKTNSLDNVITITDYERLLKYAQKTGYTNYWYIFKTLAGTGIRVGELQYITIEAVKEGQATIENKGKIRVIPISKGLKKLLLDYAKAKFITKGVIFRTKNDTPISNPQMFRVMKYIAGQARVNKAKVHAHSFRHLFGLTFMEKTNNITELADILGHSSLETTRIYTRSTTKQKADKMDKLGL